METQIKYVSLPRPRSHCFTDIFGVLSQRPEAQLPSTKATLVAFTAPAGGCQALSLSPGSLPAGRLAPSTQAGPCAHFGGGWGACCPSSLRLHIPARSIRVCRIHSVSPPGDTAGGWDVGGPMGQAPKELSLSLLQGHLETPNPSKRWRGGRKRSISPRAQPRRRPALTKRSVRAPALPGVMVKVSQRKRWPPSKLSPGPSCTQPRGQHSHPGNLLPTLLPGDGDLTAR